MYIFQDISIIQSLQKSNSGLSLLEGVKSESLVIGWLLMHKQQSVTPKQMAVIVNDMSSSTDTPFLMDNIYLSFIGFCLLRDLEMCSILLHISHSLPTCSAPGFCLQRQTVWLQKQIRPTRRRQPAVYKMLSAMFAREVQPKEILNLIRMQVY